MKLLHEVERNAIGSRGTIIYNCVTRKSESYCTAPVMDFWQKERRHPRTNQKAEMYLRRPV